MIGKPKWNSKVGLVLRILKKDGSQRRSDKEQPFGLVAVSPKDFISTLIKSDSFKIVLNTVRCSGMINTLLVVSRVQNRQDNLIIK